jgi:hypothetical protein
MTGTFGRRVSMATSRIQHSNCRPTAMVNNAIQDTRRETLQADAAHILVIT